jgi:hypothetical protein
MVSFMGTFTLFVVFAKVTHYPCTFLSFVRKPLVLYFSRLREPESLQVSLLLKVGSALITCSLEMTVFFSARRISWSGPVYTIFLRDISKHPGQRLNRDKTSIFFSRNIEETVKRHILTVAGVQATNSFEKYMGLPSLVRRSRRRAFMSVKDRIWNRISNWKNKFLSHVGKEILLKAVAQSIPTYTMSIFLLPKTFTS